MHIKRVSIEEGFLHGLDLRLREGLTVLVGARGSGKTSIVELIRFCLGAPAYGEGQAEVSRQQALAVLGSGRVTVTVDLDGEDVVFTRSADEESPRRSSDVSVPMPIILSQNEIEQVGRHADARLRLLDGFVSSLRENERSEDAARALVSSLTVELRGMYADITAAEEELGRLEGVAQQLTEARAQATAANTSLEETAAQRARLDVIASQLASAGVRRQLFERAGRTIADRLRLAQPLRQPVSLDAWPNAATSDDLLRDARDEVSQSVQAFEVAVTLLESAARRVQQLQADETSGQVALEDEARSLRTYVDELSEGAGAMMKRVSDLEAQFQRSQALMEFIAAQGEKAQAILIRRDLELDRLDALRDQRVNLREEAASFLNSKVGPRVRIAVNRYGSVSAYADAIAGALRGSGVQYNALAPELARATSPRELALAVETNDANAIAQLAGIASERAQRIITHLRDFGTETILTAPMNDTVQLSLLDGGTYKLATDLSVGQRCTAVLPVILCHTERVLIVDQPEDNLDNSFVADTLVQALRNRPTHSQIILATHNPNVPVLGEADHVVHLTSDGRRGEVAHAGELDDAGSVKAITDIMEGGREAFAKRAAFYEQEVPD